MSRQTADAKVAQERLQAGDQGDSQGGSRSVESVVPEEYLLGRENHENAPGIVVHAEGVEAVLSALKEKAGYDHCSAVTAQEYADRYESIYHLKKYAEPTAELSVVVPVPKSDPRHESGAAVYRTANWHEREAYDLLGIEYEDHPDLRRILLPETWQGHPLREDFNQEQPQIVTYRESQRAREQAGKTTGGGDAETMVLNLGPHHPSTHGVLHLVVTLSGEEVVDVEPDIGYIHRCEEQMCQSGTYRHQIMPYPDRWDWGGAGLCNEWAYARVAERLADIEVPEYAQVIRTMAAELSRMLSHFLAIGTYALDVTGEFSASFMYAVRDRELIQDILEELTGQRLMFNYFRLGGVAWDLPEPREAFFEKTREFLESLPHKLEEYHDLISRNEILQIRTIDTGVLPPEDAKDIGVTGPVARGSGIDYDVRRDDSYGYYDELEWDVVTEDGCDNYARLLVRMREVEESAKIVDQCLDILEDWPAEEREVQANVPRTLRPDPDSEIYSVVEGAKGELGIYIRSDGTDKPARFKIRGPSFSNLQALPVMAEGETIPDLVATIGSIDAIMGEVDR